MLKQTVAGCPLSRHQAKQAPDLRPSAPAIEETAKGVEPARRRGRAKADAPKAWLGDVIARLAERALPFDTAIGQERGLMNAAPPAPAIEAPATTTA